MDKKIPVVPDSKTVKPPLSPTVPAPVPIPMPTPNQVSDPSMPNPIRVPSTEDKK